MNNMKQLLYIVISFKCMNHNPYVFRNMLLFVLFFRLENSVTRNTQLVYSTYNNQTLLSSLIHVSTHRQFSNMPIYFFAFTATEAGTKTDDPFSFVFFSRFTGIEALLTGTGGPCVI